MGYFDDKRITESELSGKYVIYADDQPKGTAQENKYLFDRVAKEVIVPRFNALITAIEEAGADGMGATVPGVEGTTVQEILSGLKALIDDRYTKAQTDEKLGYKADKSTVARMVERIEFTEGTGIFKIYRQDGTSYQIDTAAEKIPVSARIDAATKEFVLTLVDGTEQRVSLADFVRFLEFDDGETIAFKTEGNRVSAQIMPGSITADLLALPLLEQLVGYRDAAAASAAAAAASEGNAATHAQTARSWAVGGTGSRPGEDTDNADYYAGQARQAAHDAQVWNEGGTLSGQGGTVTGAKQYAQQAGTSAGQAADSASAADQRANAAAQSAADAAKSAEEAAAAAGGGVISFNGRGGAVQPAAGDYSAEMVGADPKGSAAGALGSAKEYTDQKIAEIPAPDVSGQIQTHNTAGDAHEDIRTALGGKANATHSHAASDISSGTFAAARIPNLAASKINSGVFPISRGGTGVSSMEGTDYTTSRPRGIALMSSVPASIPNGCIVGVYEA